MPPSIGSITELVESWRPCEDSSSLSVILGRSAMPLVMTRGAVWMDGSWGVTFVQRVFGPVMMMFATETHVCTSSICWSMQQQRANDTS